MTKLIDLFLDANVVQKAMDLAFGYSDYLTDAMLYTSDYEPEPDTAPAGLNELEEGYLAEIDPSRIPAYFRSFLTLGQVGTSTKTDEQRIPEEREENHRLFLARSALVSSILASCDRKPRLPIERSRLAKEENSP